MLYPAPASNVELAPLQIELFPVIAGVGLAFTVTERDVIAVHPFELATVTEYVPAEFTLIVCVVAPVDHV